MKDETRDSSSHITDAGRLIRIMYMVWFITELSKFIGTTEEHEQYNVVSELSLVHQLNQ